MKVLHLVNEPVATSIPLELAIYMAKKETDSKVVSFYASGRSNDVRLIDEKIDVFDFRKEKMFLSFLRFYKFLKNEKPDIVHVHHFASTLVVLICKVFGLSYKVIKTEHNSRLHSKVHQKIFGAIFFLLVDKIVCNSKSTYGTFSKLEKTIASKKVSVIYNGVDSKAINDFINVARSESNGVDSEYLHFFLACRFVPQKNLFRLVRSFSKAVSKCPNLKLTIAGDGVQFENISNLISELRVSDNIDLVGMLSRSEVYQKLVDSDFYIVPSIWEGFCNSAVEAMFAKIPLVLSDIDTLNEVVGESSLRFNPESEDDITAAILRAAALSPAERLEIASGAFEFASSSYGMAISEKLYKDVYYSV